MKTAAELGLTEEELSAQVAITREIVAELIADEAAMRELDLYAENTAELYPQFLAIVANLTRKIDKGTYDAAKAPKMWEYWYTAAAQRYCKEFGGDMRTTFPAKDRRELAAQRAADEYRKIINGEYR